VNDIEKFVRGYSRFQQHYFSDQQTLFDSLRESQRPTTLLIGCCDSRVDPDVVDGQRPG
jgi:carbonic anhydrase